MTRLMSLLLLACLVLSRPAFATAQIPDVLVLDGKAVALNTNPLEPYLEAHRSTVPRFPPGSTANWRGYVATFAIRGGMLVVDKVEVRHLDIAADGKSLTERVDDVTARVFPNRSHVPAIWYTGALVIPRGKLVNYVHMGYGSTYERYTVIRVQSGHVLQRFDMDAKAFEAYRKARFAAYRKTPEYRDKLARQAAGRDAMDAKLFDDFLYQYEAEHYLSQD